MLLMSTIVEFVVELRSRTFMLFFTMKNDQMLIESSSLLKRLISSLLVWLKEQKHNAIKYRNTYLEKN